MKRGHTVEELEALKEFCTDGIELQRIQATINAGGNKRKAAKALRKLGDKAHDTNITRTIRRVEDRAFNAGLTEKHPKLELPKILIIDIETSPMLSYTWGVWKQNIGNNQVLDHSYIMSFASRWFGEDEVTYMESRTEDDSHITKKMIELLDEAHFVVAHNGKRFDVPRINTAAILNGLMPPSPYRVIDTLLIARKHFKFERNTLEHLAQILGCENQKLKDRKFNGFDLWKECLDGNDEAWDEMRTYNILDIDTLEDVFLKLRPWFKEIPNMGAIIEHYDSVCSKCGSLNIFHKGYTYTDVSKYKLYECRDCSGHSRSRKNELHKEIRENLLTTVRG